MAERAFAQFAIIAGVALAVLPACASASPEKDAVKDLIKAVKQGNDLNVAYAGALNANEAASLRRVAKCSATNLMKQQGGYFTVVWDCGAKGALGMRVVLEGSKISSISTMEVGMRPNTGGR